MSQKNSSNLLLLVCELSLNKCGCYNCCCQILSCVFAFEFANVLEIFYWDLYSDNGY